MKYTVKFIPNKYPEDYSKIQVATAEANQCKFYVVKDKSPGLYDWAKREIKLSIEDDGNSLNVTVPESGKPNSSWFIPERTFELNPAEAEYIYAALMVYFEDHKVKMKRKCECKEGT